MKIQYNDKLSGHQLTAGNVNEIKLVVNTNADETQARFEANENLANTRQATNQEDLTRLVLGESLGTAVSSTVPITNAKIGQYYDATPSTYANFSPTGIVIPVKVGNKNVSNAKLVWTGTKWGVTYIKLTPSEESGTGTSTSFTDLVDAPADIKPHSLVIGNEDGSGLIFTDNEVYEGEYTFKEVKVDENGIVLWGILDNGEVYQPKGLPEEVKTKVLTKVFNEIDLQESSDFEFQEVTLDVNGYVLSGIRADGSTYMPKGIPDEVKTYIKNNSSSGGLLNNSTSIIIPKPRVLPRVDFIGFPDYAALSPDTPSRVGISYNDFDGNTFSKYVDITIQGQFTQNLAKKNLGMDLLNEDGSSFKIQFGDWAAFDSFHLKADYSDSTHIRNLVCAKLFENMTDTHPIGKQHVWDIPFSSTNTTLNQRFGTGAKGLVDGFFVEVYADGVYLGLHNWNLKKHRDNYNMTSSNKKHILMDCGMLNENEFPTTVDYTRWEMRNPKYSGTVPPAESTTAFNRLLSWVNVSTPTEFKADASKYFNVNRALDYYIHMQLVDNWDGRLRNFLLGTIDSNVWWFHVYDMDASFGSYGGFPPGEIRAADNHINTNAFWTKLKTAFNSEMNARYAQLMQKNIITVDAVSRLVLSKSKEIPFNAYKREFDKWPNTIGNAGGVYGSPQQIIDWYSKRVPFMNTHFSYVG